MDLADRQLGVGVDDADVGAEGELQAPPRACPWTAAITGTSTSCHTQADLLAEVGDAAAWGRARGCRRPGPVAVGAPARRTSAWNPVKPSGPAQNDAPSPESTTTRTPRFGHRAGAGCAARATNIGPSSRVALLRAVKAHIGHAAAAIER